MAAFIKHPNLANKATSVKNRIPLSQPIFPRPGGVGARSGYALPNFSDGPRLHVYY
jgi:hypothetical protein